MNKVLGITAILSFLFGITSAQVKFGARTGVNIANQSISGSAISPKAITGYYAGVFAEIGIKDNWSIQPELQFALAGSKITPAAIDVKTTFRYAYLPILIQYQLPANFKVGLGGQVGYAIGGEVREDGHKTEELDSQLDAGAVASLSYKLPWVGLGVDTRYYFGLANQNEMDPKITNRVFSIGINYRF